MHNDPLSSDEEAAWRALARVAVVLPRLIDAALLRRDNLTLTEYMVLMVLSEHPDRACRMSELLPLVPITPSGLTRLMERLERQGMVTREKATADGRGQIAALTEAGQTRLVEAWPGHLEDVRRMVLAHLGELDLPTLTRALTAISAHEDEIGPARRRPAE